MGDKPKISEAEEFRTLIGELRSLIRSARRAVVRSVDTIQVLTNFEIGRRIVEHEQKGEKRAGYGKRLLEKLSAKLTTEFGRGFSRSNLEYMRNFYLIYQGHSSRIPQMPSGKLPDHGKSQTASGKFIDSNNPSQISQIPPTEFIRAQLLSSPKKLRQLHFFVDKGV